MNPTTTIRDYTQESRQHFNVPDDQQTFGEKAVGLSFNPSGDDEVAQCKRIHANAIDQMNLLRDKSGPNNGTARHASVAITDVETAQMRAVKALTWKD